VTIIFYNYLMNKDLFSNKSNKDIFPLNSLEEKKDFTTKKRSRKKTKVNYSSREEERILQYALKLSEKEQKIKTNTKEINLNDNYSDIEECKIFYPNEEDFKNPITYFDNLWNINEPDTGIIKIIPPESWKKNQNNYFQKEINERANLSSKNLLTRKQNLGKLYKAKVRILIFFVFFLFYL